MTAEREKTLADWNRQFDELISNPKVLAAITKRLPNDEDETDLDAWGDGMDRFMRDNEEVLKGWFNK